MTLHLKKLEVRLANRSWPAVSQICILTFLSLYIWIFILKSMATVGRWFTLNSPVSNFSRIHVLPTPLSPTIRILIK